MLTFISRNCTGCILCEQVCAFRHTGMFSRTGLSIRIISDDKRMVHDAAFCRHCKKPACVATCPVGAISRDASGLVKISAAECIGCARCVDCPLGGIHMDAVSGLAVNCDLCDGAPACVAHCPSDALRYRLASEPSRP